MIIRTSTPMHYTLFSFHSLHVSCSFSDCYLFRSIGHTSDTNGKASGYDEGTIISSLGREQIGNLVCGSRKETNQSQCYSTPSDMFCCWFRMYTTGSIPGNERQRLRVLEATASNTAAGPLSSIGQQLQTSKVSWHERWQTSGSYLFLRHGSAGLQWLGNSYGSKVGQLPSLHCFIIIPKVWCGSNNVPPHSMHDSTIHPGNGSMAATMWLL